MFFLNSPFGQYEKCDVMKWNEIYFFFSLISLSSLSRTQAKVHSWSHFDSENYGNAETDLVSQGEICNKGN